MRTVFQYILMLVICKPVFSQDVHSGKNAAESNRINAGSEMVLVEGGTFTMGSNEGNSDEKPAHQVTVSSFYIDKYEVTVAQFKQFVDVTGYNTDAEKSDGSNIWTGSTWEKKAGVNWRCDERGKRRPVSQYNYPVIHVSWNDAAAFAAWAGKRLPTEAEWEFAAKGGRQSKRYKYSGGDNPDAVGWLDINSGWKIHPPGQKQPDELGIYDMSGNVFEWCSDWYDGKYYSTSPKQNPHGPLSGQFRVLRGGSWVIDLDAVRPTYRNGATPEDRSGDFGFRCAKAVK
ncbi:MAG: formylglycine-generating enzyme family protein [bacterium]